MEFSLLKRNSPLTPSLLRLPSGMASAKFFKVSPLSHTGIFDSDEVQSTDSPFSLPVLRLNHGNCKVFSAAASQPTPTGISALGIDQPGLSPCQC